VKKCVMCLGKYFRGLVGTELFVPHVNKIAPRRVALWASCLHTTSASHRRGRAKAPEVVRWPLRRK
jgi:hypothetical protein